MSALSLEAVTLWRGPRPVLDDISVTFAAGRLTAVIGPNGAGKSTLLTVAAGLLSPDSGAVRLGDDLLTALPKLQLAIRRAYLPQRAQVEWPISVERVVALGLLPEGVAVWPWLAGYSLLSAAGLLWLSREPAEGVAA